MTHDRFDFDEVFGKDESEFTGTEQHYLELDHHELMILVSAVHSQWSTADLITRMNAASMCQARLSETTHEHLLSFAKKLVAFHNTFHKE